MCGQRQWRSEVTGTWPWGEGKPAGRREERGVVGEPEEKAVDFTILCDTHLSSSQDVGQERARLVLRSRRQFSQSSHIIQAFSSSPLSSVSLELGSKPQPDREEQRRNRELTPPGKVLP